MHALRCLFFIKAYFQIEVWASHTPGVQNDMANANSQDNLCYFSLRLQGYNIAEWPSHCPCWRSGTGLDVPDLGPAVQELFAAGSSMFSTHSQQANRC